MALQHCTQVWGNTTLVRSAPLVEHHRDVIFVPLAPNRGVDNDPHWGIFDSGGRLIEASCYFRGPHHTPVCQQLDTACNLDALPEAPDPHYLYGGPIINHYGHFIISTLSRLWNIRQSDPGLKIAFHGHGPTDQWLSLPYRAAMLNTIGIDQGRLATFFTPTRIRKLTIARPALEEQNFVHAVLAPFCNHIGDTLLHGQALAPNEQPLYFTKTGLGGGVTRFSNEALIVDVLARNGFEIKSPETMPLAEQVHEFATRRLIVGTSSSAFHTSIFHRPAGRLVCVTGSNLLNSNFILIDKANRNHATYVYPAEGTEQSYNVGGFSDSSRVVNPAGLAEDLLRLVA